MYWGKYVQHDNNRDGMGQFLALTRNVERVNLDWKPTVLHDLHEAQTYLYASTGTGPYNESIDPITIDEWWMLAENDVMEMTRRGVPGVWTYGFYDGWVPNYMFFIAHGHNAIGRFYEVQSYGPDPYVVTPPATTTSREWFRPNPPLATINWGPRNNVNIQQSAALFALSHVARNRELYLENYWLKNKRAVEKGKQRSDVRLGHSGRPVSQGRRCRRGQRAAGGRGSKCIALTSAFKAGSVDVKAGDYVIRGDQPYRTLADMYFSVQNYAPANPRPYDDTGWTFQYMRNVVVKPIVDKALLDQPMTLLTADAKAPGVIDGTGPVIVVEHTTDNNLMSFRFRYADVKMQAAEEDFEVSGHKLRAGAFIIPNANRSQLEPAMKELGLSAWAVAAPPSVKTHDLDVPRIGYVHSWSRTQDEGWVRAALDTYNVPYTYFGDIKLREGNLRSTYDVIIFPHVGGNAQSQVNGIPKTGDAPLPYKKSPEFPSLGANDQSDDIRGGMGFEGLVELVKFVQQGGTLDHRRIDVDDSAGIQRRDRHHRRESVAAVRPRLDRARRFRRQDEPAGVRLRGSPAAGLFQSGSSPGNRRRRWWRWRPWRICPRQPDSWRRHERDANGDGLTGTAPVPLRARCQSSRRTIDRAAVAARGGGGAAEGVGAGRPAAGAHPAFVSSCSSPRIRTTCCCREHWLVARRSPTARNWSTFLSARGTSSPLRSDPSGDGRPRGRIFSPSTRS